jgi:hypothetical protein
MWLGLLVSATAVLLTLYLLGRQDEEKVRRDWELLLSPRGERLYRGIEARVRSEAELADHAYVEAFAARELGSFEEARHLLDVGYRIIERLAPDLLKLLAAMATFSRTVTTMAPTRPVRAREFRSRQVRSLARLGEVLHAALFTTAERFRLRLYILGRSLASVKRFLLERPSADATLEEWQQIDAAREDFRTLTDTSLATVKQLLDALHRRPSPDLLWQLAERREQWRETPPAGGWLLFAVLAGALLLALAI